MKPICPFCLQPLKNAIINSSENTFQTYPNRLFCKEQSCQIGELTRFSLYYYRDINYPSMIVIYNENFMIQISYRDNKTIFGHITDGIIENFISLPKSFVFNKNNPEETIQKIKTMVTFS
jgi:hypothetical protein